MTEFEKHILRLLIVLIKQSGKIGIDDAYYVLTLKRSCKRMTENKRYFKRMWEDEFYIFDSQTISEKEFDEKVEYEDYQAFADSLMGDEVVDRLNKYNKEYLDCHNDVLRLEKENEQLKQFIQELTTKGTGKIHLADGNIYKVNAILTDFNIGDVE